MRKSFVPVAFHRSLILILKLIIIDIYEVP